jgi:hypothetical protein
MEHGFTDRTVLATGGVGFGVPSLTDRLATIGARVHRWARRDLGTAATIAVDGRCV